MLPLGKLGEGYMEPYCSLFSTLCELFQNKKCLVKNLLFNFLSAPRPPLDPSKHLLVFLTSLVLAHTCPSRQNLPDTDFALSRHIIPVESHLCLLDWTGTHRPPDLSNLIYYFLFCSCPASLTVCVLLRSLLRLSHTPISELSFPFLH